MKISKLLDIIRTRKLPHPSRYEKVTGKKELSLDDIKNLPNDLYWDTVALMNFMEIRSLVNKDVADNEIKLALAARANNCSFWHHLSEENIRTILNTIVEWNGEDSSEITYEKIVASVQEDMELLKLARREHGLRGQMNVDNSLLYGVLQDFLNERSK